MPANPIPNEYGMVQIEVSDPLPQVWEDLSETVLQLVPYDVELLQKNRLSIIAFAPRVVRQALVDPLRVTDRFVHFVPSCPDRTLDVSIVHQNEHCSLECLRVDVSIKFLPDVDCVEAATETVNFALRATAEAVDRAHNGQLQGYLDQYRLCHPHLYHEAVRRIESLWR